MEKRAVISEDDTPFVPECEDSTESSAQPPDVQELEKHITKRAADIASKS